MAAFPKYHELICNTYTPTFTAGPQPSILQSTNQVTKSRLLAGGTFFRSVKDGATGSVNNIILECVVIPVSVIGNIVTEDVVFTITDDMGNITTLPTITQQLNAGSPTTICIQSGFAQLRSSLISNPDVVMPLDDSASSGWLQSVNEAFCFITSFGPTNMSGASVLPDGDSSIRTGPTYTLFHTVQAETGSKGQITDVNSISEWDGIGWGAYPSPLVEPAYDVNGNIIIPHPDCPNPPTIP